jgi:DNA-binding HxlR family transcriptional regulator
MPKQAVETRAASCSILSVLHILGKRWTIPIIETLYYARDDMSFNALESELTHITPKNLNDGLKELAEFGLVKKNELVMRGVRHTSYHLTKNGVAFEELIYSAKKIGGEIYDRPGCEYKQCKNCPLFK